MIGNMRRMVGVLALSLMSALLVGAGNDDVPHTNLHRILAALSQDGDECDTQCEYSCFNSNNHKNSLHPLGTNQGTVHGCAFTEQGCRDHTCIPDFGSDDESAEALLTAAALLSSADGNLLLELAHNYDRIAINRARRAVQVLGCDGKVIAHIPLTVAQARITLGE